MPLKSGRPGRSEMSHGKGLVKNPLSDYQSFRNDVLPFGEGQDKTDLNRDYMEQKRTDATVPDDVFEDMLELEGNPDAFGPGPKLVQEDANRPSGSAPQPKLRTGVIRQG